MFKRKKMMSASGKMENIVILYYFSLSAQYAIVLAETLQYYWEVSYYFFFFPRLFLFWEWVCSNRGNPGKCWKGKAQAMAFILCLSVTLENTYAYVKRKALYKWIMFQKFISEAGNLELIINFSYRNNIAKWWLGYCAKPHVLVSLRCDNIMP